MEAEAPPAVDLRVVAACRGDARAFSALVEEYRTIAFRTAYLITRSVPDAEDATQEAFVRAHGSLDHFTPGAPFRPWLLTIVANLARNRIRSEARHDRLALRATEAPIRVSATPEQVALSVERRQRLLAAIEALPDHERLAVTCRYLLDLSEDETAAVLDCPRGTVKSRLSRALAHLRAELGEAP